MNAFKPAADNTGTSQVTPQLGYQPSLVASAGSAPDDQAALRALDPGQRPRDD
jgi:hypothetical protein